jgi:hypothetical protein
MTSRPYRTTRPLAAQVALVLSRLGISGVGSPTTVALIALYVSGLILLDGRQTLRHAWRSFVIRHLGRNLLAARVVRELPGPGSRPIDGGDGRAGSWARGALRSARLYHLKRRGASPRRRGSAAAQAGVALPGGRLDGGHLGPCLRGHPGRPVETGWPWERPTHGARGARFRASLPVDGSRPRYSSHPS